MIQSFQKVEGRFGGSQAADEIPRKSKRATGKSIVVAGLCAGVRGRQAGIEGRKDN